MNDGRSTPTYDPLPEDIASWLASHDWQRISQNPQRPTLWTLGNRELLQPTIRDANDYELRMTQMLRSLASWADRSVEALAEEMIHEGSDVTEWRANGLSDRDYSVPLEDGLALVQSVRNAFVAAANATIQRRGYFGHSTLKAARDHARAVRMGQTRRGSYIVPIISRVPGITEQADEQQGRLDVEVSAQPFERRVMVQLADALQAVHELAVRADREPSPRELNERIGDGVSHELCAALDNMLAPGSFGDIDVSFSWARRAASHPNVRRVEFPKQARTVISNMAESLRGSDVIAEQVLSGFVWITKHTAGDSEGSIKVHAQIGTKVRTVTVPLSREQVHEAQAAAAEEAPVFVRGQLVREQGRAWHFESVSEFGVAEAAPLSWGSGNSDNSE
jgi:hypothetical protein